MKCAFLSSFLRDVRKLPDKVVRDRVRDAILAVEGATDLRELSNLKKLRGERAYYRIRVGEFRIGVRVEEKTVIFVRVLARRDIYRYFP